MVDVRPQGAIPPNASIHDSGATYEWGALRIREIQTIYAQMVEW